MSLPITTQRLSLPLGLCVINFDPLSTLGTRPILVILEFYDATNFIGVISDDDTSLGICRVSLTALSVAAKYAGGKQLNGSLRHLILWAS